MKLHNKTCYALFLTLIRKKEKALADTTDSTLTTTTTTSFDETDDQSMTTISSSRRRESSTIPTPRIHSSIDTNSNTRRSKKNILDSNDIILEPQLNNNKNVNHYISPLPEISLNQSEELIQKKYTDLLINFFETHQPTYIFEPLRKEYYWIDEQFDEEKITRLEKYVL